MCSILSAVDCGFRPWYGQTKDYKIGICCFENAVTFILWCSKFIQILVISLEIRNVNLKNIYELSNRCVEDRHNLRVIGQPIHDFRCNGYP